MMIGSALFEQKEGAEGGAGITEHEKDRARMLAALGYVCASYSTRR
jgi:hypothetical protein